MQVILPLSLLNIEGGSHFFSVLLGVLFKDFEIQTFESKFKLNDESENVNDVIKGLILSVTEKVHQRIVSKKNLLEAGRTQGMALRLLGEVVYGNVPAKLLKMDELFFGNTTPTKDQVRPKTYLEMVCSAIIGDTQYAAQAASVIKKGFEYIGLSDLEPE